MQISQLALFRLCCASFLMGLLLGLIYDFLYMTRLWLMLPNKRYSIPAIQKLYMRRIKKGFQKKQKRLRIALFLGDIFFCFMSAFAVILLLYWLNNGAFRAAAPFCICVGFLLWRVSISKGIRVAFQWLAFGLEIIVYMLLMPIKRLFFMLAETCKRNAKKRRCKRFAQQRQTYTKQQLQNIDRAAEKLSSMHTKFRM